MEFREKVELEDVIVKRATEKALLCEIDGEDIWVPQSQIDDDSEVYEEGDEGTLVVSQWWASKALSLLFCLFLVQPALMI